MMEHAAAPIFIRFCTFPLMTPPGGGGGEEVQKGKMKPQTGTLRTAEPRFCLTSAFLQQFQH